MSKNSGRFRTVASVFFSKYTVLVEDNKQQQGKAGTKGGLTVLTCVKVALLLF